MGGRSSASPVVARAARVARIAAAAVPLVLVASTALAGEADVERAQASCRDGVCTIRATVRHADEGWDHYADRFEVLSLDGELLATRVLRHPHVGEQPFTRALSGVRLPPGTTQVRVRAHDSVHGYGGRDVVVTIEP